MLKGSRVPLKNRSFVGVGFMAFGGSEKLKGHVGAVRGTE